MRNVIHIMAIVFIFSLFSLCSKEQSEAVSPQLIKMEKGQKHLILADNQLGYDIFRSLWSLNNENSNILISPISLNKSMAILLFATDNDYSIRKILQLSNIKKEEAFTEIEKLSNTIFNIDEHSEFKNATRFLAHNNNTLTHKFKKFITSNKILKVDYLNTNNPENSNDKVSEKSLFNIENEITLQCNFKYQSSITESPFYLNPDKSKFVEMFVCESEFNFYSDDAIKAIEMPLGRGNFNALIILPEANQSLQTVKNKLNKNYINKINKKYRKINLSVHIPQLDVAYSYSLNKSLRGYSIDNLFSSKTKKYRHISKNKDLYLNNLSQTVRIKTISKPSDDQILFEKEKGTSFFIDHPFLLIITEKYSGSIVFIGQIVNPIKNTNSSINLVDNY